MATAKGKPKEHSRRNGEGAIYQIKSGPRKGRWMASTPPDPVTGKRTTRIAQSADDANRKLVELMAKVHSGEPLSTSRETLAAFATEWLENTARKSIKPSSYVRYHRIIHRHIVPHLGKMRLSEVQPQDVSRFVRKLEQAGCAPNTINAERALLSSVFKQALEWQIIARNPVASVKPVRVPHKEIVPLTPDEVERFIEAVKGDHLEALYLLAVIMGMREGEMLALKWRDVDFIKGTVNIRATLCVTVSPPIIQEPKSRASMRKLRIPSMLVDRLRAHRERQEALRHSGGLAMHEDGLVFPALRGGVLRQGNFQGEYKQLLRKARVPDKRFHDLRHTAASIMIADGIPIKMVSEILGHASVNITWQVYGHLYDKQRDQALDTLERRYNDL